MFFKNKESLLNCLKSDFFEEFADYIEVLSEELNYLEKENIISKATKKYHITFATATYGRGTDFITLDHTINGNGGTHVILTFFPEDEASLI